ncbi:hypothetical protein MPRI_35840 [Mycobacterium paraintracellulare]|uniref:HNH endonuclease n=1 Tax=Mycobacterium paraintracellulare TaxID=1138383 RepID=A0ABM7KB32_9MYCO|nr:hypothetical protein MPRI_35840 [Mycobacterium paraintracellulare]
MADPSVLGSARALTAEIADLRGVIGRVVAAHESMLRMPSVARRAVDEALDIATATTRHTVCGVRYGTQWAILLT